MFLTEAERRDDSCAVEDFTKVEWSLDKNTPGTAGMFLKGRSETEEGVFYLKLSSFNSHDGFYGHEAALELIASRVADVCGFEHIPYRLVNGRVSLDGREYVTPVCISKEYRAQGDKRLSLEAYVDLMGKAADPTGFLLQGVWGRRILEMMVFDYIIYNRDRHGGNMEVLENGGNYRLVPIFDNGCCLTQALFAGWREKDNSWFLSDGPANNYLGTKSLETNLKRYCAGNVELPYRTIPDGIWDGLDGFLEREHLGFLEKMLNARYQHALDLLCQ